MFKGRVVILLVVRQERGCPRDPGFTLGGTCASSSAHVSLPSSIELFYFLNCLSLLCLSNLISFHNIIFPKLKCASDYEIKTKDSLC